MPPKAKKRSRWSGTVVSVTANPMGGWSVITVSGGRGGWLQWLLVGPQVGKLVRRGDELVGNRDGTVAMWFMPDGTGGARLDCIGVGQIIPTRAMMEGVEA